MRGRRPERPSARTARSGLLLIAALVVLSIASAPARASTVAQQIQALPTVQPFNGEATSLSQFASNWTAFAWASAKGTETTTGWRVVSAYPVEEAAYFSRAQYSAATGGAAAAVTMPVNPGEFNTGRFLSLWIDTTTEAARSGYELRLTATGLALDAYDVTLSKWQAGTRTLLASQTGVRFVNGNSLAVADQGGTVTAWINTGSGFTQLLTATDATFNQGYVGLGGAGNITRLATFKAGQLSPAAPTLTSTSPASPANDNAPKVLGSAVAGTTVKLYANATCSGTPATTGTAAALASPGIAVSVADNTTTTFYATATDALGNASDCSARGIAYTERSTGGTGIAAGLEGLATLDAFTTPENPVSGGGRWTKLSAATYAGQVAGSGTTGGWGPWEAFPVTHGAYWNPARFDDAGAGVAVAATLATSPSATERYFSVWLDMPDAARAQTGYELRFTNVDNANRYDVTLTKWQAGVRTVLARQSGYTLAPQSSFALVDQGGTVSAWVNAGSGYGQLLSASDTAFAGGYAGIEGAGNITRVRQFRAGVLPSGGGGGSSQLLTNLPGVDSFEQQENPLSRGGTWAKLAAAAHAGQVEGNSSSGGWGPYNAFPSANGAYWKQEPYSDAGGGAAVAATLGTSPSAAERYFSLWLDMPEPDRAQTGYEARFTQTATANAYDVTLSKWQAGVRTVLATMTRQTIASGGSFALLDDGGTVSVWTRTGSSYAQIVSAADATFERGYVGLEGAGNITRLSDFKAGDSTLGYPGVQQMGTAQAEYRPETQAFTYQAEPSAVPMTAHFDPIVESGGNEDLPFTTDAVTCATSGHRIKVVYSTAAYPAAPSAETLTAIRSAVGRMNAKFIMESLRSSGNARALTMRVDCDANGTINVYNVSVGPDGPEANRDVAKNTLGNPSGADSVKYLIFRDAPAYQTRPGRYAAGIAYLREEDARKSSADDVTGNKNRTETSAAIIYRSFEGSVIWQSTATVHELVHTMGAVLYPRGDAPPFATTGSHCTDGYDIMCYSDGSPEVYTETRCPPGLYAEPVAVPLDCGNDTYFNASPTAGGWLGTHWNVGGGENPFLVERSAEIPVGGANTQTFETLREIRDGPPGSVSVYGHVNTTNAGAHVVNNVYVNVNFQKWENESWVTKEEHTIHPVVTNGYYEANSIGTLGVGRWRTRTVLPEQRYYHESLSEYHEFTINTIPTTAFITLDGFQNGAPGTASLHGRVLRTGNEAPVTGRVNVNFQKLVNGTWTTQSTAVRTLDANGYWEVVNWGVGVGSWRVRAVYDQQDGYAYAESEYRTFDIQPVPTEAPITLDGFQNGAPGTASLHGHILRVSNRAPASGRVNVNFQKLVNGTWTTQSTAVRTLDANGYWEVVNWGVGVGSWRVRAVYDQQGDYAAVESEYRTFDIQPVPVTAYITLDGWQNGAPGTASLHGTVLRNGNNAPASGNVNVNFQKWNGSSWQTMSTAVRGLDGNGYWAVSNWGVGLGSWRVRAVYDQQGDYAYAESEYRSFDINPVATQAYLTVDQAINGSPGRVNVSGNVLWGGGGACCSVNVNFQKLINGTWTTQSTATPGLSGGHYVVSNWGVGVGSWRVRAVFNPQGDFAGSESEYHGFTINR